LRPYHVARFHGIAEMLEIAVSTHPLPGRSPRHRRPGIVGNFKRCVAQLPRPVGTVSGRCPDAPPRLCCRLP
jgi:hypothetical protein